MFFHVSLIPPFFRSRNPWWRLTSERVFISHIITANLGMRFYFTYFCLHFLSFHVSCVGKLFNAWRTSRSLLKQLQINTSLLFIYFFVPNFYWFLILILWEQRLILDNSASWSYCSLKRQNLECVCDISLLFSAAATFKKWLTAIFDVQLPSKRGLHIRLHFFANTFT